MVIVFWMPKVFNEFYPKKCVIVLKKNVCYILKLVPYLVGLE